MDSLVPAFVAALLAQVSDRPPWLAAILSERFARPGALIVALLLAQGAVMAMAAGGAMLLQDMMTPNARALLFGVALLFAAGGAAMRPKPPADRLEGWRIGGFATAFLGLFVLAFGDRTQFVAFGAAAYGANPILAGVGATLGATAAGVTAILSGERAWVRLPLRLIGSVAAGLLGLAGLTLAIGALRLI